ncbi:glycerol kinase [Georgenia soli]|uniref:ATP:glycerol 3-phosphotransferase n=1 Tax=Georgenia soli TaxID=638953 RepID=A0A2A9F368_9MICO|nr:glycerol kinase GlpK [Georgenia soli]PFG44895.1 glycerol kinase [Georgenia soli]
MTRYVLAIDEGSSSARAVLVDLDGRVVAEARNELQLLMPHPGWVELDPLAVWDAVHRSVLAVMDRTGATVRDLVAVGVTTHRETVVVWDRTSGQPVHNAIMWSSKQTDGIVQRWSSQGLDEAFRTRTGLRNDSFFTAAKLAWLMENVPGARQRAERGELAAGTIDSWILWNLTGGQVHLTDHSEASRTALFNLANLEWDEELCRACGIPTELLAPARPSDSHFGEAAAAVFGGRGAGVPITAVLGDQQAGMIGQAGFGAGTAKNTYGTTGVLSANCGSQPVLIDGLTSSVLWTLNGQTAYQAEGVAFHSGQTVQWLRDKLRLFGPGDDVEAIARSVPDSGGVYLVPAFAGMCAPWWARNARGSVVGLTLETSAEHVVRAGLEALAYQTRDIVDAFVAGGMNVSELKVDGGAARNNLMCQFQADILGIPVVRPVELERTALGIAYVAGAGVGVWKIPDDVEAGWSVDRVFEPQMPVDRREELYVGWLEAISTVGAQQKTSQTLEETHHGLG